MSENMIYLDRNENNYGPAPACYEVLKGADLPLLSWYTKAFERGVKSILSERIAKDFDIDESRVALGYGAEDLLKQIVQCYLGKDEKLMIPSYSWWYYKKIADEVGGKNVEYPLIKGKDDFYYDVDALLKIYEQEKPKIIFISSPNNPTGNSISKDDLNQVLEATKNTIVVLDEAYVFEDDHKYVNNLLNKFDRLVVVRTFSKYFALAGLRIGYAVQGKEFPELTKFTQRYLGFNRLSEEIAIAALNSPQYYKDVASKMNEDKELFYKELNALDDFNVFKSDANFILVEINPEIKKALKEFLLERKLSIKFMNEEVLNSHLRITLGTQEQNKLLVEAIKEFASVKI